MSAGLVGMRDYDETARIVLMEHPKISVIQLWKELRAIHGADYTAMANAVLWRRYRGNGQYPATHDIETGLPLRGAR